MPERGPEHPMTYREEIVAPLFRLIESGESCAVIGSASMGKSRLLQFILRPDVQQHYLGDHAANTVLALADCNRLAENSEWGLYELMLTAITEAGGGQVAPEVRSWLAELRREAIVCANPLLARRHAELATQVLCREHHLRLCIIWDEFDLPYRTAPATVLANLRAIRDADRYNVCYMLMLREDPAQLRDVNSCEGFYELVSRSLLGLKPFSEADAERVIAQLSARRNYPIVPEQRLALLGLAGGHPGLLVALFDLAMNGAGSNLSGPDAARWAVAQPTILEECRKIWAGLPEDEQLGLSHLARCIRPPRSICERLILKGLVVADSNGQLQMFSPILAEYASIHGKVSGASLWLDEPSGTVWVEGQMIDNLPSLPFDLLRYLYNRLGELCERDEILAVLYPDEILQPDGVAADNRVDSLVRHLRKAIEPNPARPRYLLTVRGRGFRLVAQPSVA